MASDFHILFKERLTSVAIFLPLALVFELKESENDRKQEYKYRYHNDSSSPEQ